MKSLFVRLAAVGMVASVALLAIAQAQREQTLAGQRRRRQHGDGGRRFTPHRGRDGRPRGQSASVGDAPIERWIAAARKSAPAGGSGSVLAAQFYSNKFADSARRRPRVCRGRGSAFQTIGPGRERTGADAAEHADPRDIAERPAACTAAERPTACAAPPDRRRRSGRRAGPVSRRSRGCSSQYAGASSPSADRVGQRRRRRRDGPAGRQAA